MHWKECRAKQQVWILHSSQRPGEVGNINIRGQRSINAEQGPLYVVDGMVIQKWRY